MSTWMKSRFDSKERALATLSGLGVTASVIGFTLVVLGIVLAR